MTPITEKWLSYVDFKWRKHDRQPNKHWSLKLNIPDDDFDGFGEVTIEVQRRGWQGRKGYIGDAESWMLWLTDTFDRSAFVGNIRWQEDIIGLAEIIMRRKWKPENHIYGQAWPDGSKVLADHQVKSR